MLSAAYNGFKNNLLHEAERWVLWLPVFFGTGIGIYFGLYTEPKTYIAPLLIGLALIFLFLARRNFALKYMALAMLTVSLGFAVAKTNAELSAAPVIYQLDEPVTISGNIDKISYSGGFPSLILKNLRIDDIDQKFLPEKLKLNVRTRFKEPVRPGDRIITDAKLAPPNRPAIPGGYDFAKFAYFDRSGANGYAVRQIVKLKKGGEESYIEDLRYRISNRIRASQPGDVGAMCDAIITGERSYLSKQAYDNMRKSGLAHLIAISGMNLVLAGAVLFFAVRFLLSLSYTLSEIWPIKKIAALAAIAGDLFYLLISGMPVSASRSFIMVVLVMLGILLDRAATPMRSIALAAIIVLIFSPESMLGPSFQMSFAATIALISIFELFTRKIAEDDEKYDDSGKVRWYRRLVNKLWLYPLTIIASSLIGGLATAPFAAFHFNQFVNYGLLANLGAIPLNTLLVMPGAVIGMVLMPLGLEDIGLAIMGLGIKWTLDIAAYIAALPYASVKVPPMPVWGLVTLVLGGLWFLLWTRRWRYWGFILILIALLSPLTITLPDILINETGKLFAINNQSKLYLSNLRNSFAAMTWLSYFAQEKPLKLEKSAAYDIDGHIFTPHAGEKCEFTLDNLCITAKSLSDQGAHNIYLKPGQIVVETVEDRRGKRLWNQNITGAEEE